MRITLPAKRLLACAALALTLGASACSSNGGTTESPTSTPSRSAAATSLDVAALKAQLPERIRSSGQLIVGTHIPFPPMEFEKDGKVTGFDIDLVNKIAETLGLRVEIRQLSSPELIGAVASGEVDMTAGALFDTRDREQHTDMVSYMRGGTQWARRPGTTVDPQNACGLKVGAVTASTQLTVELPAKSQACEAVGEKKIDAVGFASERDALTALVDQKVDAVSTDSPVVRYAAQQSNGKIEAVGNAFDTQPYAFPVAKGSPLGPVLQKVIQHLIDSGEMKAIADRWGLHGMIVTSSVNAAMN